MYSLLCCKVH